MSNDGRGTTWPESAADTIVSLECDTDFTGIDSSDHFEFVTITLNSIIQALNTSYFNTHEYTYINSCIHT